jgi:hypothetical protein
MHPIRIFFVTAAVLAMLFVATSDDTKSAYENVSSTFESLVGKMYKANQEWTYHQATYELYKAARECAPFFHLTACELFNGPSQ